MSAAAENLSRWAGDYVTLEAPGGLLHCVRLLTTDSASDEYAARTVCGRDYRGWGLPMPESDTRLCRRCELL